MLEAAVDHNTVSSAQLPAFAFGCKLDVAFDDVDKLVVGMAVARTLPTFLKVVTHQHKVRVVSQDLADHARFWRRSFCGVSGRVDDPLHFVNLPLTTLYDAKPVWRMWSHGD